MASVPLCTPISIDDAMAWSSTTPKARGTTYPTTRLGAQKISGHQPDVGEVVADVVALVEQDAEHQDREDDRGADPHRPVHPGGEPRAPGAHQHPDRRPAPG